MTNYTDYDKVFGFFFEKSNTEVLKEMEDHISWCFGTRMVVKVKIGNKSWDLTPAQLLALNKGICIMRQEIEDDERRSQYVNSFKDKTKRLGAERRLRKFGRFLQFNHFFREEDLKD